MCQTCEEDCESICWECVLFGAAITGMIFCFAILAILEPGGFTGDKACESLHGDGYEFVSFNTTKATITCQPEPGVHYRQTTQLRGDT